MTYRSANPALRGSPGPQHYGPDVIRERRWGFGRWPLKWAQITSPDFTLDLLYGAAESLKREDGPRDDMRG
ncbi:hypothetical protein SRHO_G00170220 [Serrasalmus rhombeus]